MSQIPHDGLSRTRIHVAKDKHDCFIQTVDGKVLFKAFSFANNYAGFEELYAKIISCNDAVVRVGLESVVSTVHSNSIYAMLLKYPSAKDVAKSQFHSLVNLLASTSRGKIGSDKAKEIRNLARKSVGVYVSAKVLELRHSIKLIQILDDEIVEVEENIKSYMQELHSPIEFQVSASASPPSSKLKSATLNVFLRRIKFWLLLDFSVNLSIRQIHFAKCHYGETRLTSCQQIFKDLCFLLTQKA